MRYIEIFMVVSLSLLLSITLHYIYIKLNKIFYYVILSLCFLTSLYVANFFPIPIVFGVVFGILAYALTSTSAIITHLANAKLIHKEISKICHIIASRERA